MSVDKASLILVGTLSDGRMQAWTQTGTEPTQGFSRWKITTDPNSGWTDWQPFPLTYNGDDVLLCATVLSGTLQSQLFGVANAGLVWQSKASRDATSGWQPWVPFSPQPPGGSLLVGFLAAGVLGIQLGPYDSNTPVMLWAARNDDPAVFAIHNNSVERLWQPFQPQFPLSLAGIWPLYVGPGTYGAPNPFPVWGVSDFENRTLYWTQASLYYNDSGLLTAGPIWSAWQPFTQLPDAATVDSFGAGVLSDGRIQLFASDKGGSLYSIWQVDPGTGSWMPSWTPFPQPGGLPLLVSSDPDNVLFPYASPQSMSLALGSLPDQRLQLFAVDNTASLWTTWKTTTDPNSSWTLWSQF